MLLVHFARYIFLQLTVHHQVYLSSPFLGHTRHLLFGDSQASAAQNAGKHEQHHWSKVRLASSWRTALHKTRKEACKQEYQVSIVMLTSWCIKHSYIQVCPIMLATNNKDHNENHKSIRKEHIGSGTILFLVFYCISSPLLETPRKGQQNWTFWEISKAQHSEKKNMHISRPRKVPFTIKLLEQKWAQTKW